MGIECPVCNHDDQIVKVSSIFTSGFNLTSQSGPAIGIGLVGGKLGVGIGGSSSSGVKISQMSLRLKPPEKPTKLGWFIKFIICSAIGSVLSIMFKNSFIFGWILPIGFFIFWVINSNKKFNEKMIIYEELIREWDQSYFCVRDDIVFRPGENYQRKPEEMQSYFSSRLS